jgi:hypothetical protein
VGVYQKKWSGDREPERKSANGLNLALQLPDRR